MEKNPIRENDHNQCCDNAMMYNAKRCLFIKRLNDPKSVDGFHFEFFGSHIEYVILI